MKLFGLSAAVIALAYLAEGGVQWVPLLTFALPGIGQLIVVTIIISRMYERIASLREEVRSLRTSRHKQRNQITALLIHARMEDMIEAGGIPGDMTEIREIG